MSVDLAAANLPIVASSFAAQDISQGAGQLSESHGATRASGSPAQHRGHDAVQKVSDLIHASARRRAAATRKRPPGKAKKILSGLSRIRIAAKRTVPGDAGADALRLKVFQLRNAATSVRHFSCGIRSFARPAAISRAAAICINSLFFLTMEARRRHANRNVVGSNP
ncbi:hypothetical protein [Burkholderia oklahomensis]|uniref:hypothetical protein n=1 Tax=Burkholderia oklahomensis TaxID=342113 RepID=UPI001E519E9F|nr:hypothetical protein [Burkholderia oklahomensis]